VFKTEMTNEVVDWLVKFLLTWVATFLLDIDRLNPQFLSQCFRVLPESPKLFPFVLKKMQFYCVIAFLFRPEQTQLLAWLLQQSAWLTRRWKLFASIRDVWNCDRPILRPSMWQVYPERQWIKERMHHTEKPSRNRVNQILTLTRSITTRKPDIRGSCEKENAQQRKIHNTEQGFSNVKRPQMKGWSRWQRKNHERTRAHD
jgi:hypothetical protein